jgi:hypothetical protein
VSSYAAIAATMEAVIRVLRASYDPAQFNGAALDFQVYVSDDFNHPMEQGISLFLYRVYHGGVAATPRSRLGEGRRPRARLSLEAHFLATAWARKASLQHEIAGWMMRVLEDNAIVPAGLLNSYRSGVFDPEETVTVAPTDLSVEEVFRIWEVMIEHAYQLSVPYVARPLDVESERTWERMPAVQERVFHTGVAAEPAA